MSLSINLNNLFTHEIAPLQADVSQMANYSELKPYSEQIFQLSDRLNAAKKIFQTLGESPESHWVKEPSTILKPPSQALFRLS